MVDAIRDAFLGRYATMNVLAGTVAVVALAVAAVTAGDTIVPAGERLARTVELCPEWNGRLYPAVKLP